MPDKSPASVDETDARALRLENKQLKARLKDLEWWLGKTFRVIGSILGVALLWYLLTLVPKANAMPVEAADDFDYALSQSLERGSQGVFVGTYVDDATGLEFDLHDSRVQPNVSTALASFYANIERSSRSSSLDARDWKDCENLPWVQWACCSGAHGFGKLADKVGVPALTAFLTVMINNNFSNGRDNKKPRSECHTLDGQNVCVSWAEYSSQTLRNSQESAIIAQKAAQCAQSGNSSQYHALLANGDIISLCISNRPNGCGDSLG